LEVFVKYIYTFLALLGIVFASHAQQPTSENFDGKNFDKSKFQQVASPNRTSSMDWARSYKPNMSTKNNGDKKSSNPDALVWVDSKGETVGRAFGSGGSFSIVVVPFEKELAALQGLATNADCDLNNVCTFAGGRKFARFFQVVFTGANCTGTPLAPSSSSTGTRYEGIPIIDGGETFIYIFDFPRSALQTIRSVFSNGNCFNTGDIRDFFAPVIAVVPASAFGTEPFFLK
jgi:hypothetical protein